MPPLSGRTVALLESRMESQLASMVQRLGGTPVCAPAVRDLPRPAEAARLVESVAARHYGCVVFLTGTGAAALVDGAAERGLLVEAKAALNDPDVTVSSRGPKPLGVLNRAGIHVRVTTRPPHTTEELLEALEAASLEDVSTLLVHYGERNDAVAAALRGRGATLHEVCPYEWAMPEGHLLANVVHDIIEERIDTVLFTSQVQCRHLFARAAELGLCRELAERLNRHTVVGAVGPVCANALRQAGVVPDVMPAKPNLPSLVGAVADYFDLLRPPLVPQPPA